MKATELRIGNYVKEYSGKIFKFELQDFCNIKNSNLDADEYCLPIPLTEELLLKCGFDEKHFVQWNGNGADYQPKDVYTQQKDFTTNNFIVRYETFTANGEQSTEMFCGLIGDWYEKITFDSLPIYQLKHLHQLQNIFFELTNQELKIIL